MSKKFNILTGRNAFFASLFFAAVILAFLAPRAAVNVDEQLHYPHAKKVVNWYYTGGEDTSCLETPVTNLKYYGQSVDNFSALFNRVFQIEDEFLTRHYFGALFFWVLLFFAALIAYEISGSMWLSAMTVVCLMLMPRLFGQAFGNLKDIPFASGYAAGIYFIVRFLKEMPRPQWSTAIWLGISIAFTSSVRIGGLILLAYIALFSVVYIIILKPFAPKQNVSTKPCLVRLLGQGLVIGIIGYFAGLLFWPFAWQDVFRNPLESLNVMEHYKVSIRQIFDGNLIWSTNLPWYYLPKWLLISTPEFIFTGIILCLIFYIKNFIKKNAEQLYIELFLLFALLFPLLYVIVIKSNLYSGVRQMIFVLPLLGIFAMSGFYSLLKSIEKKTIQIPVVILFISLLIIPFQHQKKTFPVDYVYFNSISGGNKSAWGNYEYDYYFHGIKESSKYLIDSIGNEDVVVATNCNLINYFEKSDNIKYQYSRYLERSSVDWDYGLFGINYIHPELLKSGKWFSMYTEKVFFHGDNPVAVLVKRSNKWDYEGIKLIEEGKLAEAKIRLELALRSEPKNVWLCVQLAKISIKEKDFESFQRYLQNGKEIYPQYEPLFLLEAQHYYDQDEFTKSKEVLNKLMKINNRYQRAKPLLIAVNEKLNI